MGASSGFMWLRRVGLAAGVIAATGAATPGIASASVSASPSPALCTFTVDGHYRAQRLVDSAFLTSLGVPSASVPTVLNNFDAIVGHLPANSNVHCVPQGSFTPYSNPYVGGVPKSSAPYLQCQLNNETNGNDTLFAINEAFLQSLGVPPTAWPSVLQNLESDATKVPAAWGVNCVTQNAGNSY